MRVGKILRDEMINIFAMTYGIPEPSGMRYQIFLCKKKALPEDPFILFPKKTGPEYLRSEKGVQFSKTIKKITYEPKFIAFIDSELMFDIKESIFKEFYEKGYFNLWKPSEPLEYFSGEKRGYLPIFRVFTLKNTIDPNLIKHSPNIGGRHVITPLLNEINVDLSEPVISDSDFKKFREDIEGIIERSSGNLFKGLYAPKYPTISSVTAVPFKFRPGFVAKPSSAQASQAEKELDITLRHNDLQAMLYRRLVEKYGGENVGTEVPSGTGTVDVMVRQEGGFLFYEIKTASSPRACLREALGQLLEYAFWPGSQEAIRLIVVGETELDEEAAKYLCILRERFSIPLEYERLIVEP